MGKYIDVEKLKAEIERQKHILNTSIQSGGDYGQSCTIVAYDNILSLIDSLQQEQSEVLSGEDVMTMCNQILIDWTKEGETQEEKEQREQAHMRFFELYDNYLTQEKPEVDLEKEIEEYFPESYFETAINFDDVVDIARHFWNKGYNARKKE